MHDTISHTGLFFPSEAVEDQPTLLSLAGPVAH